MSNVVKPSHSHSFYLEKSTMGSTRTPPTCAYLTILMFLYVVFYTIAHSKRRPVGFGVFDCALATVTLTLINLLCYIQHLGIAEMAIYKSAVYTLEDLKPHLLA